MKKILFYGLLIGSLFGESDFEYKIIDKKVVIEEYKQGLELFKKRNFKDAYGVFNRLFLQNLNDPNINFYLGRSAFELGLYDEAILAYDRILFEDPDLLRVQFEVGRTYFAKGDLLLAKRFFYSISGDEKAQKELLEASKQYLALIEKSIARYKFGGVMIVGVNYDSNINNSSKYDYFDYPNNVRIQNTTQKVGGMAHQEVGLLNYSYKLEESLLFKNDILLFNKSMFQSSQNDKNIKMISVSPSLSQTYNEKTTVDYGVFVDNLWMGGKNYMQSYGFNPKIIYTIKENETINSYLKYQNKNYQQNENKSKDSIVSEFGLGINYPYSNVLSITSSFGLSNEKKKDGNETNVDNHSSAFGLSSNYIYSQRLFFTPSLNYKKTSYETRTEYQTLVKFGTTYLLDQSLIFQAEGSYTIQNSDEQPFSYRKYNFGINLIKAF